MIRRAAVTLRMLCGLKKVVWVRVVGLRRRFCGGGIGSVALRGRVVS